MAHFSKTASQWCSEDTAAVFELLPLENQTIYNLYALKGITPKARAILELLPAENIMDNVETALTLHGHHIPALKALSKDSRSANLDKISKLFKCQVEALEDLPEEDRVVNLEKIAALNWYHIKALGVLSKAERASNIDKIIELNDDQAQIPELLNTDVRVKFLEKAKAFQRYHVDVLKSLDQSERTANFEKITYLTAAQALVITYLPENKTKYIDRLPDFDWETAKTLTLLPVELRINALENNATPQLNQCQNEALESLPLEERVDNIESIKLLEHRDCATMANLAPDQSAAYLNEATIARQQLKELAQNYLAADDSMENDQPIESPTTSESIPSTETKEEGNENTCQEDVSYNQHNTQGTQSAMRTDEPDTATNKEVIGGVGYKEGNLEQEYGNDF